MTKRQFSVLIFIISFSFQYMYKSKTVQFWGTREWRCYGTWTKRLVADQRNFPLSTKIDYFHKNEITCLTLGEPLWHVLQPVLSFSN